MYHPAFRMVSGSSYRCPEVFQMPVHTAFQAHDVGRAETFQTVVVPLPLQNSRLTFNLLLQIFSDYTPRL